MNDRPAMAVFVKTPGLSTIKTRLAADLGRDAAEEFYRRSVTALEEVAREAADCFGIHAVWAVAEPEALEHSRWQSFSRIAQGTGGLGERLNRVYRELLESHPTVLLVGSDAPLITTRLIGNALATVGRPESPFAISRSSDGGYALFAGRRSIPREVWLDVPYGIGDVARTFVTGLTRHGGIGELDWLDDVDRGENLRSLARFRTASTNAPALNASQRAVVAFARELFGDG